MATTTVGTIQLLATIDTSSYKRGAKEIEKANSDIEGSAEKTDSVAKRTTSSMTKLAVRGFQVAAAAALALGAAIATMTIKGGIDRALNIEDAQAKLRGLGHDVQSIENIMTSALDAVRGTAYGLDDAATIAAGAVAAGVKPGKELTKYLGLTADAATIAGVSLSDMGSIFGKVQTGQRAYTMELNQLADRGIPIYQWLQEELGLSQQALREMVSAGELDSATYFKVIDKNIGGAALESGKTTRGAWANMQAAMSRVGEAIVKDIIPKIRNSFGDMTKWFDVNSDKIVKVVGDVIATIEGFAKSAYDVGTNVAKYLAPKLQSLWKSINDNLIPILKDLWHNVIEPLIPVFGTTLVGAIGLVIDTITFLIDAAVWLYDKFMEGNPIILGLAGVFGTLALAMAFNAVFNALTIGFNTLTLVTIPKVMASVGGLAALISSPIIMPAIVIGAALAAIATVWNAYSKMKSAIDEMKTAQQNLRNTNSAILKRGAEVAQSGVYSPEMKARWAKLVRETKASEIPQLADGAIVSKATLAVIGEGSEPEAVIPLSKLDKMMSGDNNKTEYNIGTITISSEVDGERWLRRLTNNTEIVSHGLVPQQQYMGGV